MTETKGEYNLPPGEDGVDSVDLADLQRQAHAHSFAGESGRSILWMSYPVHSGGNVENER
jgi:hypothetical protein